MKTLQDVFHFLGYRQEEEHLAFIKYLASLNCFAKPAILESEEKSISIGYQRRKELAIRAVAIWEKSRSNKYYSTKSDELLSDVDARKFLHIQFSTLEEGFTWLSNITDVYFLRDEFFEEGIGIQNELLAINTARWVTSNKKSIDEIKSLNRLDVQLYDCARLLHLVNEIPWPIDRDIKNVVIIGSLEKFVSERFAFLKGFKGNLYFLTGPRGLFNHEPSLALILAEWFNLPDRVKDIQKVLDRHLHSRDPMQWTINLSGLKREILKELGVAVWPKAPQSYYYHHKELYDEAARIAGREMLDCEGGPWPVAMDMAALYFKKRVMTEPSAFGDIRLVPVVALGKGNRLATMNDTIEAWYLQYGKEILSKGDTPVFVTCNTMHTIPFAVNNIIYKTSYQDAKIKYEMLRTLNGFINKTEMKVPDCPGVLMVGPAAKEFSPQLARDSIAKLLFTKRANLKKLISEYELSEEKYHNRKEIYAKKMILYHQYQDYLLLASATINLSYLYYTARDYIKTGGLFNFAVNVLNKKNDSDLEPMINALIECTLSNLQDCAHNALARINRKSYSIDMNLLRKYNNENKLKLIEIRKTIYNKLIHIHSEDALKIQFIYKLCFKWMRNYYIRLIDQSIFLLGKSNGPVAFSYLGSYSRRQMTPFSDVESFMIVDKNEDVEYSKELTKLILLKVLNLGETILSSLGIRIHDYNNKEVNLKLIYDTYTIDGFSFDQNVDQACKTPLGKKRNGNVMYRLIGTPESLVARFSSVQGCELDYYLPQLFALSKYMYGDKGLYNKYKYLQGNRTIDMAK